jgi:hypothetical protein
MKLFISANDDVVNNQIRDVEHRHYKGVLYFQTAIRVHERCVTVISFNPQGKYCLPCSDFPETVNYSTALHAYTFYRITNKSDNKLGNYG